MIKITKIFLIFVTSIPFLYAPPPEINQDEHIQNFLQGAKQGCSDIKKCSADKYRRIMQSIEALRNDPSAITRNAKLVGYAFPWLALLITMRKFARIKIIKG